MHTSAGKVPSFYRVFEACHLLQPLAVQAKSCTHVVCAVGHDLALFCDDFYSICQCSVYEYLGSPLLPK